jgi:hypothetical protein
VYYRRTHSGAFPGKQRTTEGVVTVAERTTLTVKVSPDLKARYKRALADEQDASPNMSADLRGHIERVVDDAPEEPDRDDGGYYPSDPALRELYEACRQACDENLKVYEKRHAADIAQTAQVSKSDLADALVPLRQKGYLARGAMPVDLQGPAAERWRHYHVKPPCANPMKWKYRESD